MKADFIEHTTTAGHGRKEWAHTTWEAMKEKGATFGRISHPIDEPDNLWIEGWKVRPDDRGLHPWESAA